MCVLRAIYAADAAITIGTMMSAPIAGLLLLIAKTGEMLRCYYGSNALMIVLSRKDGEKEEAWLTTSSIHAFEQHGRSDRDHIKLRELDPQH